MLKFLALAVLLGSMGMAAALPSPNSASYHIDLAQYFPSPAIEQAQREELLAKIHRFETVRASSLHSPKALRQWLRLRESLCRDLQKHDIYVYLRAETDIADHADASADASLGAALDRVDAATTRTLAGLGPALLQRWMAAVPALARYRYFIDSTVTRAAHATRDENAERFVVRPALTSLAESYRSLRPPPPPPSQGKPTRSADQEAFESKWAPYATNQNAFAAILIPVVRVQDGKARLEGFSGAPEAAYLASGLSPKEVDAVLEAVRASGTYKRYEAVVANAAAHQLGIPLADLHPWDLARADQYQPPPFRFPDAVAVILQAVRPVGPEYSGQFARLFDPASHRVELCTSETCDHTGFSVGYSGSTSGLFYGSYRGDTNSVRATAHEAGHAVHRQFMNEDQPLAVYNDGPHFLSESFAIFNELLLLDHLYRTAPTPAAQAYYLHQFLDDATFQVYGSARETDLEQSIYAGVRDGTVHSASDLDDLTWKVFSRYLAPPALAPEMKVYWAWNRLYFTDPLYDTNYLFAGLLALQYVRRFEKDPQDFARRYTALLKNGYTDTPQVLERRFLGIDLDNADRLVGDAAAVIDQRSTELERLYGACQSPAGCLGP